MNEIEYKKKCDAMFQKAKLLNLELAFEPDNFDPQRLNCLWHGGHIAEVKVSDKLSIDISVCGDVCADLYDEYCNHIEHLKDKGNNAVFADVMGRYIRNDSDLKKAIQRGRLKLDYNNWVEYDGLIRDETMRSRQKFIDLGIVCDNVLDDNILTAIGEVLDSWQKIVSEIRFVAQEYYKMPGGEAV